jgi:hypothetical protein
MLLVTTGVTVLTSWLPRSPSLAPLLAGQPGMSSMAGACFMLVGLALLMVALERVRWLAIVCAGVGSVVSLLTVVEWVFGVNPGFDFILESSNLVYKPSSHARPELTRRDGFRKEVRHGDHPHR